MFLFILVSTHCFHLLSSLNFIANPMIPVLRQISRRFWIKNFKSVIEPETEDEKIIEKLCSFQSSLEFDGKIQ